MRCAASRTMRAMDRLILRDGGPHGEVAALALRDTRHSASKTRVNALKARSSGRGRLEPRRLLRMRAEHAASASLHGVGRVEAVDERGPIEKLLVQLHVLRDAPQFVEVLAADHRIL